MKNKSSLKEMHKVQEDMKIIIAEMYRMIDDQIHAYNVLVNMLIDKGIIDKPEEVNDA